jgi:hypothetical protein
MSESFWAFLFGGVGALLGGVIQYYFQRFSADREKRREIIETCLLQLQNSLESLYYRINNLRDWGGQSLMSDGYYRMTSLFILGRVLAQESLLVSQGIYAKLHFDEDLKKRLKAGLHAVNWGMDNHAFLHYHRMQLAEMLLEEGRIISYTEFQTRLGEDRFRDTVAAAEKFIEEKAPERLDGIRETARRLVRLLEQRTAVPSALSLAGSQQK